MIGVFLLTFGFRSHSQWAYDAVEVIPGAVIPIMNDGNYYVPGWALNANYYYDDSYQHSLYGGIGVHQMQVQNHESGYYPFFALQAYYGAQYKFVLKEDLFDLALGGELGWMLRFYTGNPFSGSFNLFMEQSMGLSPKLGFNWRINKSWATLGAQIKYNAYFSLNGLFYSGNVTDGIHQWLQPGITFKIYL